MHRSAGTTSSRPRSQPDRFAIAERIAERSQSDRGQGQGQGTDYTHGDGTQGRTVVVDPGPVAAGSTQASRRPAPTGSLPFGPLVWRPPGAGPGGAALGEALVPPTPPTLWPYQVAALEQLDAAFAAGRRAPLLVLPTGAGKTVIAAEMIRRTVATSGRVLFLAPRRELVAQTSEKLDAVGVEHGVILSGADERAGLAAAVQVASVDTLVSRVLRREMLALPACDLVLVDEAHLSITNIRRELLECWPAARRVGLTATPTRKDGHALGLLYDAIIEPATTATLVTQGYLAKARYFSWPTPDLTGVRTCAGDYNLADLELLLNKTPLLADVVATWLQHAPDRRTVVYCVSIAHAVALAEAFRREQIAAEHVDAGTPAPTRAATFARFRAGTTQVLTNCFLAAYGFDLPALSCVVLARPTRSLMLYLQMLGRGLRIADDKRDCLVLDHSGAVHRHGLATDERRWTLSGRTALVPSPVRKKPEREAKECPECHAVWIDGATCPECGYERRPKGRMVETLAGELVELGAGEPPQVKDKLAFYAELRGYALERGYKPGWAAHKFRERHGVMPPWRWNDHAALPPSRATRGWVRSRWIARRKEQEGAA
jgi:DNA repair protein RadD